MFRLHKFLAKQVFFAVITVQLLGLAHARVISQCGSEAGEFKENSDTACKAQYPWIYCNGAESAYCTSEQCLEEYKCTSKVVIEVPSAPVQPIILATTAPVPVQPITPPTVAPILPIQPIAPTPNPAAPVQPITPPTIAPAPIQLITTPTIPPVTVQTTNIIREKCKVNEKFAVPYFGSCRYYYHCGNGYFGIGDCGLFMFFDVIDRKCKIRTPTSCQQRRL